ncbi:MAG TPA: hypothetical protein VGP96_16290 [Candidatus Dormibacteraeota bacterium]|nr:hypothetical protein [Candidatus Dormibacteraeota bacterium]
MTAGRDAGGGPRPRVRAAPADGVDGHPRLRVLPPAHAWVLLEAEDGDQDAVLASLLPRLLERLEPAATAWVARIDGPADQVRYLLDLAAAEGVPVAGGGRAGLPELRLPAGHALAATLLGERSAGRCMVLLLAQRGAPAVGAPAAAVMGGCGERWGLAAAAAGIEPALIAAAAAGAAVEHDARPVPGAGGRVRRRALATAAVAAGLLLGLTVLAAAWWRPAGPPPPPPPMSGPAPEARQRAAAAFDPGRGELVLFGGSADRTPGLDLGDTWTWTPPRWRLRRPAAAPSPRFGSVMAGDPARRTVVLFGGERRTPASETLDDTWTWDGATWTRREPPAAPPPGALPRGLEFDVHTATSVLVVERDTPAGTGFETWTWDGSSWAPHPGAATPPLRWIATAPDGGVLGVGEPDRENRGSTWSWDGSEWQRLTPQTEVRVEPLSALLAYDPGTNRTLLVESEFLDVDGRPAGGTWSWDGRSWTEHHSAPPVVAAFGVTAPLASREGRLVLVGGSLGRGAYRDAWEWDGSAWRRS